MNLSNTRIILYLFLFSAMVQGHKAYPSSVVIAGKNTTTDSSILFGITEDNESMEIDYMRYFPRRQHPGGAFIQANVMGLKIPQVRETYAYWLDECPPAKYSNMVINEWGLAFGSNVCRSKEDPVKVMEEKGQLEDGGIGFMLRIILAQRAKTARQAVLIAAELIERYGYRPSGRNLNIVGPDEAWQLQMARGKHYVARRVHNNEVAIVANTFSIGEVTMDDRENFITSPGLIEYAEKRGWYDPGEDGAFDFAEAYADERYHTHNSNNHRQWIMARQLDENFLVSLQEAELGEMPAAFELQNKISVKDVMEVLRNHYEDTELDKSENHRYSPHHTPRTICNYSTHKTAVVQQRSTMPVDIGTVMWRALGQPCQSIFVPWYLGAQEIPEAYQQKTYHRTGKSRTELLNDDATNASFATYHLNYPLWKHRETDVQTASCVFHQLGRLIDAHYEESHPAVRKTFDRMEKQALEMQPYVEEKALRLYKKNRQNALDHITEYTNNQAIEAYEKARSLSIQLMME